MGQTPWFCTVFNDIAYERAFPAGLLTWYSELVVRDRMAVG
jgi:hypothetical protein